MPSKKNIDPNAERIIDACESEFEANKTECNYFVIAVADAVGVQLSGQADEIVDQIKKWGTLKNGIEAKQKADEGFLVVGGLKAKDISDTEKNGHVVIVVAGELDSSFHKYPTGYWGKHNGVGEKKQTINYAFRKECRDKVIYAATKIN